MNRIEQKQAIQELERSGKQFIPVFESRYLSAELYKPDKADLQSPHDRDEVYLIISGEGQFELEGEISNFSQGDFIFVQANASHRFLEFSNDFVTWVFFVGPKKE